jgi:hypothetical protein
MWGPVAEDFRGKDFRWREKKAVEKPETATGMTEGRLELGGRVCRYQPLGE